MRIKNERGSFTIEAILSLSLFMFGFMSIISLATIAKVESTTQYAIDQVAKEVAQYYYIAEKVGIANTSNTDGVKEIDDAVEAIMNFTNTTTTVAQDYSSTTAEELDSMVSNNFADVKDDINDVAAAAQQLANSFDFKDPQTTVSSLATMMIKQAGNEVMTKVIAQPLCKALVPKYITSNGDADETLKKMGVVNGLDGLDFRMSSFLSDQRSINIVVVYQIKVNGYGIFDDTLVIKQTASTAAWVKGTSLEKVATTESNWEKGSFDRGKAFVDELQNEAAEKAVKEGVGVDIYEKSSNTFKSVHSLNVFSASYSDFQKVSEEENSVENYTLKKSKIKSATKKYANDLLKNVNKIDGSITMDNETTCQIPSKSDKTRNSVIVLVVPEEASTDAEMIAILNEIAREIETETGVKVEITYRDKALG